MSTRKVTQVIQHFHNHENNMGGLAAMLTHIQGDSFVYLTTAHCSSNDRYVKKVAVAELHKNYNAGAKIKFGITERKMTPRELRDALFELLNIYVG